MITRPYTLLALTLALMVSLSGCGGGGKSSTTDPGPTTPEPQPDTTPASFSFTATTGAALNSVTTSNTITVSGINTTTTVSVVNGQYAIDNGSFTNAEGTINNGQTLQVQVTNSANYQTTTTATVTIGGVSASYSATTMAEPIQGVAIDVNPNIRHSVGGVDSFDRRKFITIHASNTENDWFGGNDASLGFANESEDLITEFLEGYDVYFGRDTGGISWHLSQTQEDPAKPGFADEANMTSRGNDTKGWYTVNPSEIAIKQRQHEHRNTDMIIGSQQHPFWPDGKLTGQGWALSQTDTEAEPFGTATGHYMANFLAKFYKQSDSDPNGQPKPLYVEVMNEPLYELVDDATNPTTPEKVFQFHNTVADEIRKLNDDVLIGGYTVAFPDFDSNNFERWENRDKAFIDIAGEKMDFISIHLYDFPNFQNTQRYRKGSNVEATFDMLDHYTTLTLGAPLPLIISEYGAPDHALFDAPWTPYRDGLKLKALNSLLMSMLERPDTLLKTIPFIPVKAEWGRDGVPYNDRLMRQKFEAEGETGNEWVYTDLVKFYQLWADVNGTRVDSYAADMDILVDSYVDGSTLYVILNNLEFNDETLTLTDLGLNNNSFVSGTMRHLHTVDGNPVLSESALANIPTNLTIGGEATIVLALNFENDIAISETSEETKYYATTYKQAITANTDISFAINNVTLGDQGEAILRLGIGRDHGLSLQPSVSVNGVNVEVPSDYRGYDQFHNGTGRPNFYGVIEIPVPYSALQTSNTVVVNFPDSTGFVTTAALQVFNTSTSITRPMQ
ncbi:cellulase family glycosylhydrolase [Saccharophagus degradans]|uniref:Cellulase family glycosylhydrolase n=1 Tax=Saccharophagus degradans TaxID=86304 RepID=A0AAW7XDY5_9GAMM|nr:cellulase family glycosylhydrolase [Saccharophagus degradans]MDO6424594.1 cellulase family glycosylhydrolase [Saccharophagus degradans]MDO6608927.1 cellulase family glycosylhydrolase [Saccharophagus degradans]